MRSDWLAQLAPAHAPPPPGWWPPAPGWWGLALSMLLSMLLAAWLYRMRSSHRLRRTALLQLKELEQANLDDTQFARGLQDLLRRYAVATYGRETVASLTGTAWVDFLATHGGSPLAGENGECLLRAAYGGAAKGDRARWLAAARTFIRWHK